MKTLTLFSAVVCLMIFASCENVKVEKTVEQDSKPSKAAEKADISEKLTMNIDSLVASSDQKRTEIEKAEAELMEVSTADLKEKIKQKWEKIHFYTVNGNLVRIKTYPYENITNRTEEFYLRDGDLFMAVIEDDGSGERGKSNEEIDKIYYYSDGELVHEIHKTQEREYSMRKSDAEELQTEVREYIDIYQSRSQN